MKSILLNNVKHFTPKIVRLAHFELFWGVENVFHWTAMLQTKERLELSRKIREVSFVLSFVLISCKNSFCISVFWLSQNAFLVQGHWFECPTHPSQQQHTLDGQTKSVSSFPKLISSLQKNILMFNG